MWTISENKAWSHLMKFDWVADMSNVPQDPKYHAEGDVAIHTQMVLEALVALPEFKAMAPQDREVLWAAALLHDVEKRSTTYVGDEGAIVSPGHAKKGAMTARCILYKDLAAPFELREMIVGLVRYHGLPIWAMEKPHPQKYLLRASLEVNTEWLAILAKADVLGRCCDDQDLLLYKIDLFKEYCIENDCWGKPRFFPSDLARFLYFRKDDQDPSYLPFDASKAEVVLLSGIAGSGKDHFVKRQYQDFAVISLDDQRRKLKIPYGDKTGSGQVIQWAKETAKGYLRKGTPFVWNATNITLQMREQLIDLFAGYQARVTIQYLEVPYRQLLRQNKDREFPIPEDAVNMMVKKLEVPKLWEATKVNYWLGN